MRIRLNGEAREVPAGCTVAELLEELRLRSEQVAVERNGELVTRAAHRETQLAEEDAVEVVTLVGGG